MDLTDILAISLLVVGALEVALGVVWLFALKRSTYPRWFGGYAGIAPLRQQRILARWYLVVGLLFVLGSLVVLLVPTAHDAVAHFLGW